MSKKLILFLMVLLFGSTSFLRADEVTIGSLEGATNDTYLPMNSLYNYSYTQQIFTAEEIGMAGTINAITMWMYGSADLPARTFDIYMKAVEKETFDGTTDWVTVAATDMVYSGTVTFNNPSPAIAYTFTLTTPFVYDGQSNLLIAFNNLTGTWKGGLNGMVFSNDGDYRALYVRQDGGAYDPYNPTFTATSATPKRNVVMLDITGSGPVPPTPGEFTITPNLFALGYRPLNGWMEPLAVRIANGGEPKTLTASLSNTAGVNAFVMSEEIEDYVLPTGEALDFTIDINQNVQAGEYTEEFTLFMVNNDRDITTIPVTANFYTAGDADIVETAKVIEGEEFNDTPAGLQANYQLYGMTEMKTDAVYSFSISDDYHFHAVGGDDFIAVYNQADVDANHLTAAVEPILLGVSGIIDDEVLLVGDYYLVVASENIDAITVNFTEIPAPSEVTYIAPSPENGATEVEAPVTLKWEGGANATEYEVLFGTSPVNLDVVLDWTMIDESYGTYVIETLASNTQYFWQIKVRNSHGTVSGPRWGFTSTLIAPHAVTVSADKIFDDQSTLVKWKIAGQGGFEGEVTVADGTSTSSYVPVYGLWMDDYTRTEMIYPEEMLEEMQGGEITSLTYYISSAATGAWSGDVFNVYMMEAPATTLSAYYGSANATIVYTGALDGQGTTMTINLDTPYMYDGGNLLIGIEEITCNTWKSCSFYGIQATGASGYGYSSSSVTAVPFNAANFLPKTTFVCGGRSANATRNLLGFNVYYDETKANTELLTEREYLLSGLEYNMEGYDINVTAVYSEGESGHSAPITTVKVSGYGILTGTVTELISGDPVEGVTVKFNGTDEFNNVVAYEATTAANGTYTINNVKAGQYIGHTSIDDMEPNFSDPVTLAYNTTETVDFIIHEVYKPVLGVLAEELDPSLAKVTWSVNTEVGPGPGPGPQPPVGDMVTVKLTAHDVWGDGSGYQMLLDDTHSLYGTTIPTTGALSTNCSGNEGIYAQFSHKIPENADGNCTTQNMVMDGTVEVQIPAGTYDWCITNPTPGDRIWIAAANGNVGGRQDDYVFEAGNVYEFTVSMFGSNDGVNVSITGGAKNSKPCMQIDNTDCRVADFVAYTGNRSVETYAVYRKAVLLENEITEADSVFFGYVSDTLYADFDWYNVEPGLYQYGVAAIYPGGLNRNNRTEIIYNFEDGTIPAEFTNTSAYPWVVAEMNGGKVMKSSNGGVSSSSSTISLTVNYLSDGTFSFDAECMGEGTSTFWDKCTFSIDGVQKFQHGADLAGWHNYSYDIEAGEHTFTWDYTKDSSVNPSGDYFAVDNITISYEGGGDTNDDPVTPITWSNYLPKDIETTVTVIPVVPDATAEGVTVRFHNTFEYAEDYVYTFEEGVEAYVIENFRKGEYELTVTLADYDSDYNNTPVSIWGETEITALLHEIFKPVDDVYVAVTGYASWTDMMPVDRYAEKYFVEIDDVFVTETTDNFIDLTQVAELELDETYYVGVAVVYSTGMSAYITKSFTYLGCEGVEHQVTDLTAEAANMNVTLGWNGATPTPPTPPTPPTGDVVIKLTAHNVWGDGTGYQMLLDNTHSLYGTTIPTSGALSTACSGNEGIYSQFSHKIPTNADGNCTTSNMVLDGTVEITIPAGTYDWCITNPTPGDRIWIAAANGNVGGRYDDYVFEGGHTYEFTVSMYGSNDGVDVTITGGKGMNQPNMGIMSNDVRTNNFVANNNVMKAGEGFGAAENQMTRDWYYYDNGVNEDAIGTGGGNFWWGIMLPAGSYDGTSLTKVAAYDYMAMTGTASIYQGGTSAPAGSALGSVNVTMTGSSNFVEYEFAEPITLDPSQNVWVVFYNGSGATYPAAVCANTGDANGRWVSLDGSTWEDLATYSLNYTFMIRAFIEVGGPAPVPGGIERNKYNVFMDGELVGATTNNTITVVAPDCETHTYTVIYVDSNYGMSCETSIEFNACELMDEETVVNSIYPNPTSGDLHINATAMTHINIVNAMGQVVYSQDVNTNETVIDMAKFESGVYMVNIITENGSSVKRVTVTK